MLTLGTALVEDLTGQNHEGKGDHLDQLQWKVVRMFRVLTVEEDSIVDGNKRRQNHQVSEDTVAELDLEDQARAPLGMSE